MVFLFIVLIYNRLDKACISPIGLTLHQTQHKFCFGNGFFVKNVGSDLYRSVTHQPLT